MIFSYLCSFSRQRPEKGGSESDSASDSEKEAEEYSAEHWRNWRLKEAKDGNAEQ